MTKNIAQVREGFVNIDFCYFVIIDIFIIVICDMFYILPSKMFEKYKIVSKLTLIGMRQGTFTPSLVILGLDFVSKFPDFFGGEN